MAPATERRQVGLPALLQCPNRSWYAPGIIILALAAPAEAPSKDIYWYIEHATTITAIPLAILGFGIAIWQIRKTRTAAESALKAAGETQRGIGRSTILLLIPQLHRTEEELERAIGGGHQDLVLSWLSTWRWQAGQLRGLLKVAAPNERGVLKSIQESIVISMDLRNELLGIANGDLIAATKAVRTSISAVTNGLGELAILQGMQIGQKSDE